MKLICFTSHLLSIGISLVLSGCFCSDIVEINDPSQPLQLASGSLPQAQEDPDSENEIVEPEKKDTATGKQSPQTVIDAKNAPVNQPVSITVPQDRKNEAENKTTAETISSPRPAPVPPQTERRSPPRSPENFRRGPGVWRAFSRLSQEEQVELLQLQRTDPERYRAIMQEKADQVYAQERARRQELDDLAYRYRQNGDPAQKEQIKNELREKLKEDFQQRLQDTRRDIEYTKRRTASLEAELRRRENNCEAIVDALLKNKLSGTSAAPVSPGDQ